MASKATRFDWSRVQQGSPGDCWPWAGSINRWGYGNCQLGGVRMNASRAAWVTINGQPADGMVVCHRCDNPACCNPDHLFLGTQAQNLADCRAKGRQRYKLGGEHHRSTAKIEESIVVKIRDMNAAGVSQSEIGRRVGLHSSTINRIVHNKLWTHA